jgi:hypothetical protein
MISAPQRFSTTTTTYMFRTLSQCLLPTFLRQNMFFQRVALSKITFVPASHSLPYSQLQNQPDDPSKPQRDGSWNNLFLDNIPPAQPPVKEESPEERWKRKSESARLRLDGISLPGPYSGSQHSLIDIYLAAVIYYDRTQCESQWRYR